MIRQALREALLILVAAAALGVLYTAATEKGMFATASGASALHTGEFAPVMIHLDEARTFFEAGEALFIDSRHAFDYHLGHIRGAVNLPLKEVEEQKLPLPSTPKDHMLIVYCDGAECNSSIELSSKLFQAGYSNVKIFFGGWREWEEARLPVESSPN